MIRALLLALLCLLPMTERASAHALDPAYVELSPLGDTVWRVVFRKPTVAGQPMSLGLTLPEGCTDVSEPPAPRFDGGAWIQIWTVACVDGLAGGTIAIPGLERTRTDALVRYTLAEAAPQTRRLTAAEPAFTVPETPGRLDILGSYIGLGIEHILEGIDHLLFVFALVLLIRHRGRLIGAITAFTVAHSITLAAAALGWLVLPGPPVEAIIALSILFLAVEICKTRDGSERLSERRPWLVSFSFGLLHGLGFAGALLEIGLPQQDVPVALLGFNLGVEIGQLMFVAVVLTIGWALTRILPAAHAVLSRGGAGTIALSYGIGIVSAYWLFDRISGFA